jgi:hypothetical protein
LRQPLDCCASTRPWRPLCAASSVSRAMRDRATSLAKPRCSRRATAVNVKVVRKVQSRGAGASRRTQKKCRHNVERSIIAPATTLYDLLLRTLARERTERVGASLNCRSYRDNSPHPRPCSLVIVMLATIGAVQFVTSAYTKDRKSLILRTSAGAVYNLTSGKIANSSDGAAGC